MDASMRGGHRTHTPSNATSAAWENLVDKALKTQNQVIAENSSAPTSTAVQYEQLPTNNSSEKGELSANLKPCIADYQQSFNAYLQSSADALVSDLQLDDKQAALVHKELSGLMGAFDNKAILLGEDVARAHLNAQEKLLALGTKMSKQHPLQVFPLKGKNNPNEFAVLKPAPPISNIVFKGGGMKGQGYVAVLKTMENHGLTPHLKNIAGTSAGAITAACLATGMSAEGFAQLTAELDMNDQMNAEDKSSRPGAKASSSQSAAVSRPGEEGQNGADLEFGKIKVLGKKFKTDFYKRSAEKLLHTFQRTLRANVQTHFDANRLNASNVNSSLKTSLHALLGRIEGSPNYQITFSDLALLHQFDPANFKQLTLTGYNKTDRELIVFNSETTPNMPIATAMRASMAIPKLIAPVKLMMNGRKKTIVDGGLGANMPSHLLNSYATGGAKQTSGLENDSTIERHARAMDFGKTMVLSFDEGGAATRIASATSTELRKSKGTTGDVFIQTLGMNPNYIANTVIPDDLRYNEAGPNGFVVHHGTMGLANFDAPQEEIQAAQLEAEVRFLEQVRNAGLVENDRAMYLTFNSISEALNYLSDEELQAFVDRKPGDQSKKSPERVKLEAAFEARARKWLNDGKGT